MHFNCLEMKYLVFCVTLNLLFFANIVSSTVHIAAQYDIPKSQTKKYEIKQALQLLCNVTTEGLGPDQELTVTWKKGNKSVTQIEELKRRLSLSHNGGIYKLQINYAEEKDGGKYSCVAYINNVEETSATISVESKIYVKISRDITVVEGERLKVVCQVHGTPTPQILWIYKNVTYEETEGRIEILEDAEKNVTNAVFSLKEATLEDQGDLACKGYSKHTNDSSISEAVVRVKDKYAALWPFLGICAEVLVLCAIILIYEKKRNKTELEESDTDQSPEQKNTPDHGGKESNLRHRQ